MPDPAPTAPFRPGGFYPFWFWNDRLDADEIRWQIAQMAAQGIRGFFIHSRQGLRPPYLSDAFFRMVEVAVAAAERHGLTAHLYDEYPYPSGVAGGEVILGRPEFQATALVPRTLDLTGGDTELALALPRGRVLNATLCPLRDGKADWSAARDIRDHVGIVLAAESYNEVGLTQYNRKRYFASVPTPTLSINLPDGDWRVFVSVQTVVENHKYWNAFVDVLNPDAVATFLDATHERYFRRFGAKFGHVIPTIFVDETAPGWSARLPAAFRERYGRDLLPLLPALQDPAHPEHLAVAADLFQLRYDLFCRSFEEPIARWCRAHNLAYTGEKPSLRLSQLRFMDVPGCDAGHTKAGAPMDLLGARIRGNARAAASAAYFYNKPGALCEAYHSLGWSATLQDIKRIAEALLLMGVPYLVPHGFFYSTHALKKHDAPPTFFFQMPYWPLFGHLARRIERLGARFEGSVPAVRVLLVEPASGLPTRDDLAVYERLMSDLMAAHIEFLHVDTDILQSGRIADGRVHLRDTAAPVVLVPPMRVVEAPLQTWLDDFAAQNGTVLRCADDSDRAAVLARLQEIAPPTLRLQAASGSAAQVQMTERRKSGRRCWLLLNTGREPADLILDAGCALREIALDDALPPPLTRAHNGSSNEYRRVLDAFESALLEETEDDAELVALPPRVSIRVGGEMRVVPRNANLLRLYDWQMSLLGSDGTVLETATVPAVPLANQLEKGGFRFAPRVEQAFGVLPRLEIPPLRIAYAASFENRQNGAVELVMEPGTILGEWHLRINEHGPITAADFAPTSAHVRGSLGMDLTPFLRPGSNELAIVVQTDRADGGLRNALYLAGDWAVELSPFALVPHRETGRFETWDANGLPFYAGVVVYETGVTLTALPPGPEELLVAIDFDNDFASAAEVSFNGGPWRPVLWTPRCVRVPRGELVAGTNALRVRVYTALERAFEGQWFEAAGHRYRDVGDPASIAPGKHVEPRG